ncbi:TPA: P-type conjugative transfer protein TrbL, partial [Pseudomonas aeruginosa]
AKGAMAGLGNVAKTGAQSAGRAAASRASAAGQRMAAPFRAGWNGQAADTGTAGGAGASSQAAAGEAASGAANAQPAWAKRLHRRQQLTHAATTTAHALRGGDGGGSGQGPSLRDSDS